MPATVVLFRLVRQASKTQKRFLQPGIRLMPRIGLSHSILRPLIGKYHYKRVGVIAHADLTAAFGSMSVAPYLGFNDNHASSHLSQSLGQIYHCALPDSSSHPERIAEIVMNAKLTRCLSMYDWQRPCEPCVKIEFRRHSHVRQVEGENLQGTQLLCLLPRTLFYNSVTPVSLP